MGERRFEKALRAATRRFWMALAHNLESPAATLPHHSQMAADGTQNPAPARLPKSSHPATASQAAGRANSRLPTPKRSMSAEKHSLSSLLHAHALTRSPVKWPSHPSSSSDQSSGVILDSFLLFSIQRVSKCC